jgi:hypothetical protein
MTRTADQANAENDGSRARQANDAMPDLTIRGIAEGRDDEPRDAVNRRQQPCTGRARASSGGQRRYLRQAIRQPRSTAFCTPARINEQMTAVGRSLSWWGFHHSRSHSSFTTCSGCPLMCSPRSPNQTQHLTRYTPKQNRSSRNELIQVDAPTLALQSQDMYVFTHQSIAISV